MNNIYMPPFVTIVFESEEAEKEFGSILSEYEKMMTKVEFLLIGKGDRKVNVTHVFPETMQEQLVLLNKAGLRFKALSFVKRYSGFAHYHENPTSISDAMIFGVVGYEERYLEEYAKAYYSNDDITQGRLLGYPECDIQFFDEVWKKQEFDPIKWIALNTSGSTDDVKGDPLLNVMLRYSGVRAIPFLPHSFTCKEALKFADMVLDLAKKENKKVLKKGLELLSQKTLWTQINGIIEVKVGEIMRIIAGGYTSEPQKVLFIPSYDASKLV